MNTNNFEAESLPCGDISKDGCLERDVTNILTKEIVSEQIKADNKSIHCIVITGCQSCPFCHWDERDSEYNPYCSLHNRINNKNRLLDKSLTLEGYAGSDLTNSLSTPSDCPLILHTIVVRHDSQSGEHTDVGVR